MIVRHAERGLDMLEFLFARLNVEHELLAVLLLMLLAVEIAVSLNRDVAARVHLRDAAAHACIARFRPLAAGHDHAGVGHGEPGDDHNAAEGLVVDQIRRG